MPRNFAIDYVELGARDVAASRRFFEAAFGWNFVEYGPSYAGFTAGLEGGLQADSRESPAAPLVILYADDLEAAAARVRAAGGAITQPIFSFPGGRRFHFLEPGGAEMAVWSET